MIKFYLQIVFFFLISCQGNFSKVKEASFDDFYNSKMNKILIDVRTPEEFEKGIALNSINLNFYDQKFKDEILKNTKENQIYIYCRSGRRSEIATKYLNENGFTNVFNIKSGIIKIDSHYLDFSPLNN